MKSGKKNKRGFSLLELLIVVAIILIIATIAVPSLLRSRQATNESACVGDLRSVNTAEVTYASSNSQSYAHLADLATAGLIDSRFKAAALIHGETYSEDVPITDPISGVVGGTVASGLYGVATTVSGTAARYDFCTGTDAVVRYNTKGPHGTSDAMKPVGN
jgi:prepilin-type N-terminal cleavage/methylation domain-containing protein